MANPKEKSDKKIDLLIKNNPEFQNSTDSYGINISQLYYNDIKNINKGLKEKYGKKIPESVINLRSDSINANLRMVIPIAKRYLGLGLSFNELISAGNLGLCYAYDKYDTSRSTLKDTLLELIDFHFSDKNGIISFEDFKKKIFPVLTYGNIIKDKLINFFNENNNKNKIDNTISIEDLKKFINKNIKTAKFSSVCNIWIRAFILEEINSYSRLVKKPKLEINKDKKENGTYSTEKVLSIHSPVYESDNSNTFSDDFTEHSTTLLINTLDRTDDEYSSAEALISKEDDAMEFNHIMKKLFSGVPILTQRIINDRFGINLPRPLRIKELADKFNLSQGGIQKHLTDGLSKMKKNGNLYDINPDNIFSLISR